MQRYCDREKSELSRSLLIAYYCHYCLQYLVRWKYRHTIQALLLLSLLFLLTKDISSRSMVTFINVEHLQANHYTVYTMFMIYLKQQKTLCMTPWCAPLHAVLNISSICWLLHYANFGHSKRQRFAFWTVCTSRLTERARRRSSAWVYQLLLARPATAFYLGGSRTSSVCLARHFAGYVSPNAPIDNISYVPSITSCIHIVVPRYLWLPNVFPLSVFCFFYV